MELHFLDFDYNLDEQDIHTWDAMASVDQARLPELLAEIEHILAWAYHTFGAEMGPHEEGGCWQYDLQCEIPGQPLLELQWDPPGQRLILPKMLQLQAMLTVNFSLSATTDFAQAFARRYQLE